MTLLWKTKEKWRTPLKNVSSSLQSNIKSNLKRRGMSTLRRCLKMLLSSKNCKLRRKKMPENSKKLSMRLLMNTIRMLTKLWNNIESWWKVKLLRLSNLEEKLRNFNKITKKSSSKLMMMLIMKLKILKRRMPTIRVKFKIWV